MNSDDFNRHSISSMDEHRPVGLRRLVLLVIGIGVVVLGVSLLGPHSLQWPKVRNNVGVVDSKSSTVMSTASSSRSADDAESNGFRAAGAHRIEPLSASQHRVHWSNPSDSLLWQSTGWTFEDASMSSSSTEASSATFRQPFTAVSAATSFAWNLPVTESDAPSASSILKIVLVDQPGRPQLGIDLTTDQATLGLDLADEANRVVVREVPVTLAFGNGYVRLVLTRDRFLTFLDERVLWNVARPEPLMNHPCFLRFETSQRSVTLSELRFDSVE